MPAPKGPRAVKRLQTIVARLRQHDLPDASFPLLEKMDEILREMDGSTGTSDDDRSGRKPRVVKMPVRPVRPRVKNAPAKRKLPVRRD